MKKLKNMVVNYISIVGKPATGKEIKLKGVDAARLDTFEIKKMNDEMMRVYGIVYSPDAPDLQDDWSDAGEIRKAADDFMRGARTGNVDANHTFRAENAYVAESWLIRKGDPMFPDEADGAWAVGIQVEDDRLWGRLKKGELTGISLAGQADSEESDPPGWFKKFFTQKEAEGGMDMEKVLKEIRDAISNLDSRIKALEPEEKEEGETETDGEKAKEETEKSAGDTALTKADVEDIVKTAIDGAWKGLATELAKGKTESGPGPGKKLESEMV